MSKKIGMHFIVSGKVQGVWFRANTQKKAHELNLSGWVKNLPNGDVEVLACGPESAIHELHNWLKHGPELAKVEKVAHEELPWEEHNTFEVIPE